MKQEDNTKGCSRRQFLIAAGAAGVGSLLSGTAGAQKIDIPLLAQQSGDIRVPARPYGKSGRQVSILGLGGMFDIGANLLLLRQALQWGVTYWDTADCYENGGSETGYGKYFAKYPQDREKIFLVSKSDDRDPGGMAQLLDRSLERLNTKYLDLYFIHGMKSIDELSDQTRKWVEKTKAEGKIRLFGFSTHRNMEELLQGAAKLGWIDGIMLTYNFRIMYTDAMQAAVEACAKAGIGLTAMKSQAKESWYDFSQATKEGKALAEQFKKKGWSEPQAKLKAVWQNPRIASICSQMDSMQLLKSNVDAAVDPTPLTSQEMHLFQQYACATGGHYCTGCGQICESALIAQIPVSSIMRYHMYCRSYGRPDWARAQFSALPATIREQLAAMDYTAAEARCPQRMPIARLMKEALEAYT
ncbi:MAG: aldo/keto reductase [Desulfobacteraceae bacterium]|nr:aldo/keto reductase [Desulfobacteraceae bacterium]